MASALVLLGGVSRRRRVEVVELPVGSGAESLGRWVSERRDVVEDYRRVYGERPENPRAVAISIDTNDTHSSAAALIGPITFTTR